MKRQLLLIAIALAAFTASASAQVGGSNPNSTVAQTCGPSVTVLGALNAAATLSCPGAAGYIVTVTPVSGQTTFIGSLQSSADGNSWRTRRWFRTGIGELDTATENLDGTQASLEYRLSAGDSATVTATKYTSGQATITITASFNTGMVFLNGPVHTADEAAVRAGRGFRLATGLVATTAAQDFNFMLTNPAGSGRNVFVSGIWLAQTSGSVLQVQQRIGPTSIPATAVTVTPTNRRPDSTTTSVLTSSYSVAGTGITTGTIGLTSPIQAGGVNVAIQEIDMLTPGQSLGFTVGGVGGGLAGTASSISAYVEEYEEGVN